MFGTSGVRGVVGEEVTAELALSIGRALGSEGAARVVVGRDPRESGRMLERALTAGLLECGADVVSLGMASTPTVGRAVGWLDGDAGVSITASHNPAGDNGIKLWETSGKAFGAEAREAITRRVEESDYDLLPERDLGETGEADVDDRHVSALVDAVALDDPLDVVVDVGNGAGGVTARALAELGCSVRTLNAQPDGRFPGRPSEPTAETCRDLREFVRSTDADLGIAHDGDADRIVLVDADGDIVHEDTVVAMLAERYVERADAGSDADPVVVTTPNASGRIDERVEAAGGRVERVALGYLHDGIAAAREAGGDVVFAAEPWKHVHPAFGGWIDGVASAALLTRLVAEAGLPALRDPVTERPYRKQSVACPDDAKAAVMARLADDLPAEFPDADVNTEYGVRLTFPDASWTLVRPSGTEPYVRVYAESDEVDALVDEVADAVAAAVAAEE